MSRAAPAGELVRKVSRGGRSVTPKRSAPSQVPKGEDDTKVDNNGFTQSHRAACRGDEKLIASIWGERKDELSAKSTALGETPAHHAAISGQVDVLRALEALPCGGVELLFAKDKQGNSIGHKAAVNNQSGVLKWLHAHENASVNKLLHGCPAGEGNQITPLQLALKFARLDSIQFYLSLPEAEEYLLEPCHDKRSAGHFSIYRPKGLESLLSMKDDGLRRKVFMARDDQGDTPMMSAAMNGDAACIPMLVDSGNGHPLDTNCNYQYNIAHNACIGDKPDVLDWALGQPGGEDMLKAVGKGGVTPLACCSIYASLECLKWFMTKGKMSIDEGMPEKGLVHWMDTCEANKPGYLDWIAQQEGGKEVILGREGYKTPEEACQPKANWVKTWIAAYKAKL